MNPATNFQQPGMGGMQNTQPRIGGMLGAMGRHPWQTAAFGGLGTAALGGLFGTHGGRNFMSNMFMGTPGNVKQYPTQTPQGMQLLNQLMGQGMQNTDFNGIQDMYMKKFYEEIIPQLSDQWSSQGDERGSSAFQSSLGRAGGDLASRLAAMRSQYGLQQSQLGLQPQFENAYHPGQPGLMGTLGQLLPVASKIGMGAL